MSMGDDDGAPPRRGLAKGLSALLADVDSDVWKRPGGPTPQAVPVEFLRPSRVQPRRRFDEGAIAALAESILSKGVLQPVIVRPDRENTGAYEIIAGERRWRAAQVAQVHEVPVVVREMSDREALETGLVENVQREDLTPIEEAIGYRRLIDAFGHGQEELAKIIGKSRSHVANTLRLLGLPDPVKTMVDDGRLSAGHGRALLGAGDAAVLADRVIACGLNVRQTEALVRKPAARSRGAAAIPDADTRAIERSLGDRLGLAVKITHRGPGGTLTVRYGTLGQLDDILRRLGEND